MNSLDMLKQQRSSGYQGGDPSFAKENPSEDRAVQLTDEEMEAMKPYMDKADDIVLEMTGTLSPEGSFTITSVKYAEPDSGSYMQRVRTSTEVSPS